MVSSKKQLAVILSKLKLIKGVDRGLEQYQTESELAADIIWNANLVDDIEGCLIHDLGCGNGIFGIGALLIGAWKCVFVDIDKKAIELTEENIDGYEGMDEVCNVVEQDVKTVDFKVIDEGMYEDEVGMKNEKAKNVVLMNPPFGTKTEHADKDFLSKCFGFADVIYSIHMAESKKFLESFSKDNGFKLTNMWEYEFGIKKSHEKHKKQVHKVPIICVRLEKIKSEE